MFISFQHFVTSFLVGFGRHLSYVCWSIISFNIIPITFLTVFPALFHWYCISYISVRHFHSSCFSINHVSNHLLRSVSVSTCSPLIRLLFYFFLSFSASLFSFRFFILHFFSPLTLSLSLLLSFFLSCLSFAFLIFSFRSYFCPFQFSVLFVFVGFYLCSVFFSFFWGLI